MVQQDPDGHHCRSTSGQRGVHYQHNHVLDITGQAQIVKFWLAGHLVGLDQNFSNNGIFEHFTQSWLQTLTCSQYRNTAYLCVCVSLSLVLLTSSCVHHYILKWKQ
ncbi:hypothetical protein BpHYR1_041053 [Brachionus plicatilis]|uniref:Uncharacterized protein n=1 Tax=Brachionus plicatilis TaxID=10195 RepID=A0A3M7QNG9_BRAPC|nr:hypothetical protein BpHYR1_041053 [Brachionus plicatilis]